MSGFWDKSIKIGAITGICAAAFIAMTILSTYAAIGGNQVASTFEPAAANVIITDTGTITMYTLGNGFLVMTYNLSMLFLTIFIVGTWLFTVVYVLREELAYVAGLLKQSIKAGLYELSKPKEVKE